MSYQDFCLDATTVQPATLFSPWLDPAAGPQYQPTTAVAVHTLQPGGVFTMTTTPPTSLLAPPTFSTVALGGVSTPTVSTSSTYQGQSAYFTPGSYIRQIDISTDRYIDKQTDIYADKETDGWTMTQTYMQMYGQIYIQINRQMNRQTSRWTDSYTDKRTDRQTDK